MTCSVCVMSYDNTCVNCGWKEYTCCGQTWYDPDCPNCSTT